MRHGISGRKLNRTTSHRLAMFRNMVTSLLDHERIFTTTTRAKELRRWTDWMITLGKRGDLHARRQALDVIRSKDVVHKLFAEIAPRFQNRMGGYTRIVKAGYRSGDAAPMCIIELVSGAVKAKVRKDKPKTPEAEKAPPIVPAVEAVAAAKPAEVLIEAGTAGGSGTSSADANE
jgi:large subunit ribosomal protein L17